jgi:hypothetical protein
LFKDLGTPRSNTELARAVDGVVTTVNSGGTGTSRSPSSQANTCSAS